MSCRMIDHIWVIGGEDLVKPPTVTHRADEGDEVQGRISVTQLQLDVIGVILIHVKDDELLRVVGGHLPTDLAADGTTATGDEDGFAVDKIKDFIHVDPDGLAAQKVFDGDLFEAGDMDFIGNKLVHAGELLQLTPGLAADIEYFPTILRRGSGDGKEDFIDFIFFHCGENTLSAAYYFNIIDVAVPFVGVIVDNGADFILCVRTTVDDLTQDHLSCCPCTDKKNTILKMPPAVANTEKKNETIEEANARGQAKLCDPANQIIGNGHTENIPGEERVGSDSDDIGKYGFGKLMVAGKTPDGMIELKEVENQQAENRIRENKLQMVLPVMTRDAGKNKIKTDEKAERIGSNHRNKIINRKNECNEHPVLKVQFFRFERQFHGILPYYL